jgi:dTDP-4-dehydrorhamnose 3,5-epimerase
MIKGVVIKKLSKNADDRGWLAEFYRNDETDFHPVMGYISVTKPGVVRGPHEHVFQSDCFVFAGPGSFELYLWDRRDDSETKDESIRQIFGEDDPAMIIVPPGVVHGYKCVSAESGYCVNLPDKLYRGSNKSENVDEIRWEEKKDSPYKIL